MQIDFLSSHAWKLITIVVTALTSVLAFIASMLQGAESFRNLRRKKESSTAVKPEPPEVKLGLEDVGIEPFKVTTNHSVTNHSFRDMATGAVTGAVIGATLAKAIGDHSHHDAPPISHEHGAVHEATHLPDGWDGVPDHGSVITDAHQTITDHAHDLLDWIGDI